MPSTSIIPWCFPNVFLHLSSVSPLPERVPARTGTWEPRSNVLVPVSKLLLIFNLQIFPSVLSFLFVYSSFSVCFQVWLLSLSRPAEQGLSSWRQRGAGRAGARRPSATLPAGSVQPFLTPKASLWPFLAFSSSLSQGHRMGRSGGGYRSSPSSPCSHHSPFPLPTAFSLTGPAWLQSTNSSQEAKNIQTNIPTAHSDISFKTSHCQVLGWSYPPCTPLQFCAPSAPCLKILWFVLLVTLIIWLIHYNFVDINLNKRISYH